MSLRWTDRGRKVFFLHVFPFLSFFQTLFGGVVVIMCAIYFSWLFCLVCFCILLLAQLATGTNTYICSSIHALIHALLMWSFVLHIFGISSQNKLFFHHFITTGFYFRNNLPSTVIKISLCVCALFDEWQRISQKSINYKSHQPPVM